MVLSPTISRTKYGFSTLIISCICLWSGLAQAQEKITIAALTFVSSSPLFIAQEKGYYAEEGLDVEFKFFRAAQPVAVAIASGDADFGVTAFTAGFYNLAAKGALRVIGAQSREVKGFDGSAVLASNKAYEGGLTKVENLAGHSFAMTQVGSSFHYMIGQVSEKAGVNLSQIKLKPLQSVPNMLGALKSGQVDSIIIVPHIAKPLERAGAAKIIGWVADYNPYQLGGLFTSKKNIEEKRDTVEKFVRAYQKGAQDYFDAMLQKNDEGNPLYNQHTDGIVEIINRYVYKGTPSALKIKAGAMYIDPKGRLDVGDVHKQIQWYQSKNLVKKSLDPKTIIDLSFIDGHFNVPQ